MKSSEFQHKIQETHEQFAGQYLDVAEGPRLMSRVDGIAPEAVTIGMPVKARVINESEQPLVVFEPV